MAIAMIVLSSGREVELTRLEVTAGGDFLEGYPSRRWNDLVVTGLARSLVERYPHAGMYVVDPPRLRPERPDPPTGPFGPVELLPPIQCVGLFASHPIDRDADSVLTRSSLVVAWYQDLPVLPFDDAMHRRLQQLDWVRLAKDHDL